MENDSKLTINNVILREFNKSFVKGSLCLSKHYLMIVHSENMENDFFILLKAIDTVRILNTNFLIEIRTKDFKTFILELCDEPMKNGPTLFSRLDYESKFDNLEDSFPFVFKPKFNPVENGWTAFSLKEEFTDVLITGQWVLLPNETCYSYDKSIIVPIDTTRQNLADSSNIHANSRFPVLAFFYKQTQSSLLRCSQYTSSLEKMASIDPLIKVLKCKYCFVDIRSKNLIKNIPLEGCVLKNAICPTEKLDVLLSSFQKFLEIFQEPQDTSIERYLNKLESSQWLDKVRQMLWLSRYLAHSMITKQCNYIIIGDTGCDFELIVCSLVQVILKSDSRTLRGFEALVDREWIQGGHPFWDRCKRINTGGKSGSNDGNSNAESPVFILFLDCVWQIMQFNPTSFEFNELFLKHLANHAYFSEFGTFVGNCAKHREENRISEQTTSLWSYLNQHDMLMDLMSDLYDPTGKELHDSICWPPVQPQNIQIWLELYSGQSVASIDLKRTVQKQTVQNYKSSKNHNQQLRKILQSLEAEVKKINLFVV